MANSKTLKTVSVPAEGQGPVVVLCITRAGFEEVMGMGGRLLTSHNVFCSLDLKGT